MKFSDKLFFAMTALMTTIFAVFGIWIVTSFFQKLLSRELEQGSVESQMFQYVFEMAYQSTPEEYGDAYALDRAAEAAIHNLAGDGNTYYVFTEDYELAYGEFTVLQSSLKEELVAIQKQLNILDNYGSHVVVLEEEYYLLSACRSVNDGTVLFLSVCKNISSIYEYREVLVNQYRFVLILLLIIGTSVIFLLSRYITRPIGRLTRTAGQIASGNLSVRSHEKSEDEIGELARSFNLMADALVERLKEKEQEALQKALEAKQQEDFTAAFAHELKTPLTSIIGYADMLGTIQMSEAEKSEAAYYIFTQGKRLESLSHKLLELVSLERTPLTKKAMNTKELEDNIRSTDRFLSKRRSMAKLY